MRARKSRRWISKAGLMDERLDLVGEVLVLPWHGQGDLQRQFERERRAVRLDGAEGDGSLKAVGGTQRRSRIPSTLQVSHVLIIT